MEAIHQTPVGRVGENLLLLCGHHQLKDRRSQKWSRVDVSNERERVQVLGHCPDDEVEVSVDGDERDGEPVARDGAAEHDECLGVEYGKHCLQHLRFLRDAPQHVCPQAQFPVDAGAIENMLADGEVERHFSLEVIGSD
jgi:hypothetical protein